MRRLVAATILLIAILIGSPQPARAQVCEARCPTPVEIHERPIPPLGWFVMGSVASAAVAPMVQTLIVGRELTMNEAYRTMFGCVAGPIGWIIATPSCRRPSG